MWYCSYRVGKVIGLYDISLQHQYHDVHICDSHIAGCAIFILIVTFILIVFHNSGHAALPRAVYTGRDKATVTNSFNFVSVLHKKKEGFTLGGLPCRTTSSVDSITDYNGFYCILSRRAARVRCRHGESHADARELNSDHFRVYLCLKWHIRAKLSKCMSLRLSL